MTSANPAAGTRWLLLSVVVLAALCIAVSGDSLWIDELFTASFASRSDWRGFAEALSGIPTANIQMPLFCAAWWGCAQVAGVSEVALRLVNVPWAVLAVAAFGWLLRLNGVKQYGLLLLLSPFVCYHMNEARPYVMSFAAGAAVLALLEAILGEEVAAGRGGGGKLHMWFVAALALCLGTTMLNLFIVPALVVYAASWRAGGWRQAVAKALGGTSTTVALIALCVVFAAYYGLTLYLGFGGQKEPFRAVNAGFACYEFLGFGGLGPPRHILREGGFASLRPHVWPLAGGAAAWLLVAACAIARRRALAKDVVLKRLVLSLLTGGVLLAAAAVAAPAALWGRHFMFLYPFFLLAVGRVLLPSDGNAAPRLCGAAFAALIAVFAVGAARQRFMPLYEKDPFRQAAAEVRRIEDSRTVHPPAIWVAYGKAIDYYGPTAGMSPARQWLSGSNWSTEQVKAWMDENSDSLAKSGFIVIMHRPDKCDQAGAWSALLRDSSATLLWQRSGMRVYSVQVRGSVSGT